MTFGTILHDRFGLPLPLLNICESIFDSLPEKDAKDFYAAIPDAVGRDGKDLSCVHWKFLIAELRALPSVPDSIQSVIDRVISGLELLASGKDWPGAADAARVAYDAYDAYVAADAADAAADAAARVARAAADAARVAADAAAYAARSPAYAARKRQSDTVLRLIKEAA